MEADRVPAVARQLAERWSLAVGKPFASEGSSWVAPADRTTDDARFVLKIAGRRPECRDEAEGLRAWQGNGAVRLVDSWTGEDTSALLLERCEPGAPLGHTRPELEQDSILAETLRRLWVEPPGAHGFRPLAEMCDLWASECEARLELVSPPDPGLTREGLAMWRELGAST